MLMKGFIFESCSKRQENQATLIIKVSVTRVF